MANRRSEIKKKRQAARSVESGGRDEVVVDAEIVPDEGATDGNGAQSQRQAEAQPDAGATTVLPPLKEITAMPPVQDSASGASSSAQSAEPRVFYMGTGANGAGSSTSGAAKPQMPRVVSESGSPESSLAHLVEDTSAAQQQSSSGSAPNGSSTGSDANKAPGSPRTSNVSHSPRVVGTGAAAQSKNPEKPHGAAKPKGSAAQSSSKPHPKQNGSHGGAKASTRTAAKDGARNAGAQAGRPTSGGPQAASRGAQPPRYDDNAPIVFIDEFWKVSLEWVRDKLTDEEFETLDAFTPTLLAVVEGADIIGRTKPPFRDAARRVRDGEAELAISLDVDGEFPAFKLTPEMKPLLDAAERWMLEDSKGKTPFHLFRLEQGRHKVYEATYYDLAYAVKRPKDPHPELADLVHAMYEDGWLTLAVPFHASMLTA